MTKVVINISGGVLQEVLSDDSGLEVFLVNFDDDDSKELSDTFMELVLEDPNFDLVEIKSLRDPLTLKRS